MARKIKIPNYLGVTDRGREIKLHKHAVTQGYGLLGKRGKGKSNLLGVMVEVLASRKQQFVILDPPEAHWGIRYRQDAKGKPVGLSKINVLLIGGPNCDIPIEHTNGREAAKIIVEGNLSTVIGMKSMSFTARQTWCADFAEELFQINTTPRFIAFEEAHNFLPQLLQCDEQKRVLYAMTRLIDEGRGIGLGFALASQRPAKVNKNVLEMVDNLFVMGMIGPNDIKAIEGWFKHHVRDKEKLRLVIERLVRMKPGEAWFLAPEWQDDLVHFTARLRSTYHAGRTPKPGERPANVSRITVSQATKKLKNLFQTKQTSQRKEVADLKGANRVIAEQARTIKVLERKPVASKPEVRQVHVLDQAAIQRAVDQAAKGLQAQVGAVQNVVIALCDEMDGTFHNQSKITKKYRVIVGKIKPLRPPKVLTLKPRGPGISRMLADKSTDPVVAYSDPFQAPVNKGSADLTVDGGDIKLRPGALRMLKALAQWYPEAITDAQIAALSGMKKSGGSFSSYMSNLRTAGFFEDVGDKKKATEKAMEWLGDDIPSAPSTTEEVLVIWRPKLRPGAQRMLNAILAHRGDPVSHDEVAAQSRIERSGGSYSSYLSNLVTAHLVVKVGKDAVKANKETLFL